MSKEYSPIPGIGTGARSFRLAMRHRLYQAADHLLLVQSTGFTEEYRRLYYRDIGCVVVRRTGRRLWVGVILAVVIAVMLSLLAYVWKQKAGPFSLGMSAGVTAVFISVFLVNLLRGPTCACYVTTRVQTVLVPAPRRMALVPRLINFLRTKSETQPSDTVPAGPQA